MDHSSFTETASITLQSDFLWVHMEPIYRLSSPYQFSYDGPILLKCWHPLPGPFFWQFDSCFIQQVFSDVSLQWRMDVLYTPDRQYSYPHNGTSETSVVLVRLQVTPSIYVLLILAAVWEASWVWLNSWKKYKYIISFSCSRWGAYNLQNQILKEVDGKLRGDFHY